MKVLVALSGGPHSLITAWLLKKQGMQVRGIYFDFTGDASRVDRMMENERKLGISIQVVSARETLLSTLRSDYSRKERNGSKFFIKEAFQQNYLLPSLFEAAANYKFDRVASGHQVTLQEDMTSGGVRIYRGAASLDEDAIMISRLPSQLLARLMLPLGSIPESMMGKLISEIAQPGDEKVFEEDWEKLYEAIKPESTLLSDPEYRVLNASGVLLGIGLKSSFTPGGLYRDPAKEDKVYRVREILPPANAVVVEPEETFMVREIHFEDANGFQESDLGVAKARRGFLVLGMEKPLLIDLLQFTGGRLRGVLANEVRGAELNLVKGQSVLWVDGAEITGGARELRIV